MSDKNMEDRLDLLEKMPERALLPFFLATMKIANESKVMTFTKHVTEFLGNMLAWFIMGLGITGIIWLMVVIFISIRGMI